MRTNFTHEDAVFSFKVVEGFAPLAIDLNTPHQAMLYGRLDMESRMDVRNVNRVRMDGCPGQRANFWQEDVGVAFTGSGSSITFTTGQPFFHCRRKAPYRCDFGFLLFCLAATVRYEKWKRLNGLVLITKSSNWVAVGGTPRRRGRLQIGASFRALAFWFLFLSFITPVLGVTCHSCFDGIEGCAGGAACLSARSL